MCISLTEANVRFGSLTLAGTPRSTSSHSPATFLPEHQARPLGWCRRAYRMWQPASQEEGYAEEAEICQSRMAPEASPRGLVQAGDGGGGISKGPNKRNGWVTLWPLAGTPSTI